MPHPASPFPRCGLLAALGRLWRGPSAAPAVPPVTDQQVRQTQALLRMAAAAGRLGAWSIEMNGMQWLWSDEVRAMHEVPAGFVPSAQAVLPLYTPASAGLLGQALEQCMERGIPFDLELQLATPAGRPAWIHVLGEADRDGDDRITAVRGAMQDISRFRSVVDEARRTAERLTHTLEQLPDGILLLDHAWRFVYVNPEAERILRRPRRQLVGRSLLTEFPETAAGRFLERCEQAVRDGRSVAFERFYPPLGIWMHMTVSPSDQGLTICIHDDTERLNARREILALKSQLQALRAAAAAPASPR